MQHSHPTDDALDDVDDVNDDDDDAAAGDSVSGLVVHVKLNRQMSHRHLDNFVVAFHHLTLKRLLMH